MLNIIMNEQDQSISTKMIESPVAGPFTQVTRHPNLSRNCCEAGRKFILSRLAVLTRSAQQVQEERAWRKGKMSRSTYQAKQLTVVPWGERQKGRQQLLWKCSIMVAEAAPCHQPSFCTRALDRHRATVDSEAELWYCSLSNCRPIQWRCYIGARGLSPQITKKEGFSPPISKGRT